MRSMVSRIFQSYMHLLALLAEGVEALGRLKAAFSATKTAATVHSKTLD
jgi:hypothetical protein